MSSQYFNHTLKVILLKNLRPMNTVNIFLFNISLYNFYDLYIVSVTRNLYLF